MPVGCLNDSLALKRIAEVLALRTLPRRSIFDMPGCEPPRMNDRKMRFFTKGDEGSSSTSFARNYRDLVVVVHLRQMIKESPETRYFIIS